MENLQLSHTTYIEALAAGAIVSNDMYDDMNVVTIQGDWGGITKDNSIYVIF